MPRIFSWSWSSILKNFHWLSHIRPGQFWSGDGMCEKCLIYLLYDRPFGLKIYMGGGTITADSLSTRRLHHGATALQYTEVPLLRHHSHGKEGKRNRPRSHFSPCRQSLRRRMSAIWIYGRHCSKKDDVPACVKKHRTYWSWADD